MIAQQALKDQSWKTLLTEEQCIREEYRGIDQQIAGRFINN